MLQSYLFHILWSDFGQFIEQIFTLAPHCLQSLFKILALFGPFLHIFILWTTLFGMQSGTAQSFLSALRELPVFEELIIIKQTLDLIHLLLVPYLWGMESGTESLSVHPIQSPCRSKILFFWIEKRSCYVCWVSH